MQKVKQLANKSKFINYKEVAAYASQQEVMGESGRWEQCLEFMRDNPKLMLQMIPTEENIKSKSKVHKRIESA
jgi:hypothetical protein